MNYFIQSLIQSLKPNFNPQYNPNPNINIPKTFEICNQKSEVEMINGKEYKIDTRCDKFCGHFDLFKELLVNSEKKALISVNIRDPYDRNSLYHYSRIVPCNFQSYQRGLGYGSYLLNKTEQALIQSKNAKFNKLYACGDGDSGEFYLKRGYKRHNQDVYKDLN